MSPTVFKLTARLITFTRIAHMVRSCITTFSLWFLRCVASRSVFQSTLVLCVFILYIAQLSVRQSKSTQSSQMVRSDQFRLQITAINYKLFEMKQDWNECCVVTASYLKEGHLSLFFSFVWKERNVERRKMRLSMCSQHQLWLA